jgi:hypothetical protein
VITKAALARELGLSRARISQLCRTGLPVRPDGKLDRAKAVAWVKANVDSWRGGWCLRRKAGPRPGPMPTASVWSGKDFPDLDELPDLQIPDFSEDELREAAEWLDREWSRIEAEGWLDRECTRSEFRKQFTTSEPVAIGRGIEAELGNLKGARMDSAVIAAKSPEGETADIAATGADQERRRLGNDSAEIVRTEGMAAWKVGFTDRQTFERACCEASVINFMNHVRRPKNIEGFARAAFCFGCSMRQAFALAQFLDLFMAYYLMPEIPEDPEPEYIQVYEEPDWNRLAAEAGTTADVEAWKAWMSRILEESKRNVEVRKAPAEDER